MAKASPNVSATPTLLHDDRRVASLLQGRDATANATLLEECVRLFNSNYGAWGDAGPKPGAAIRITRTHLVDLLDHDESSLSLIRVDGALAGYSVVVRFEIPGRGRVHWVSQLVVAEPYRNMRFATELLFSAWNFSGAYAWGLATVNPYAVRALETTTRRHCSGPLIVERGDEMCSALHEVVPYIPKFLARTISGERIPAVDTGFFIDHSDIHKMRENAGRNHRRWGLGKSLAEGHEWFAAVFGDQPPKDVDASRLEHLLSASDDVWKTAYARMALDENHIWMKYTAQEIDLVADGLTAGFRGVDVGCGVGRHAVELVERGASHVLAVDVVPEMIERAIAEHEPLHDVEFVVGDMRKLRGDEDADVVYALYDVIGSSTVPGDDERLLRGMSSYLRPGGRLVLSVMNASPMLSDAALHRVNSEQQLVAALEALPGSDAMEKTGAVFESADCVEMHGVFFRKERFTAPGDALAVETIVRDRRFTPDEIRQLVENAGMTVQSVTPVQTGHWSREPALAANDSRAKELLVFATKGPATAERKYDVQRKDLGRLGIAMGNATHDA